jgi:hypothetical protein
MTPSAVFALHLFVTSKQVFACVNDVMRQLADGRLPAVDKDLWLPFVALVWQALQRLPSTTAAEVYCGVSATVQPSSALAVVGDGPEDDPAACTPTDGGNLNTSSAGLRDAASLSWGHGACVTACADWTTVASLCEGKSGTVFLVQPKVDGAIKDVSAFSNTPQVLHLEFTC